MELELHNDELLKGNHWYNYLERYLCQREELMFKKYENTIENKDIDWRDKSMIDIDKAISEIFIKWYEIDEEHYFNNDEINSDIISDIETVKDELNDRIHDFNSNYMIPWVHWHSYMKGMDCFLLLFYYNILKKLSESEIRILFELNLFDISYQIYINL